MLFTLVNINYSADHSDKVVPLGIFSVASALKNKGFDNFKMINITEKEIDATVDKIKNQGADMVGLSVMTGMQTGHSAEFSKKLKQKINIPVLWGGIHPSLLPRQCLNEDYIDFVIMGEGEETINEFLSAFQGDKNYSNILGLGYKENGQAIINPKRPLIENLDEWRLRWDLINPEDFIYKLDKFNRVIAYKGSRGCPYNCSFCYNNKFNESRWRSWSENIVTEDIKYLKEKHNIDAVVFYDDNFFANHARAWKILQEINIPSHVEIRIDHITDDVARQISENKCFKVSIGVESGSDRILGLINKIYKVPRIYEAIRNLAKYNVAACYSAIVGLPTETKEEFQSTIKLFYDLYKIHPYADFTLGAYMPYPGTEMYDFALQNGFKAPERTEDWKNIDRFREEYDTPWVNGRLVYRIREYFKFLTWKLGPLHKWFEFRIRKQFFAVPVDIRIMEWMAGFIIEEKNWLSRFLRRAYRSYKYGPTSS